MDRAGQGSGCARRQVVHSKVGDDVAIGPRDRPEDVQSASFKGCLAVKSSQVKSKSRPATPVEAQAPGQGWGRRTLFSCVLASLGIAVGMRLGRLHLLEASQCCLGAIDMDWGCLSGAISQSVLSINHSQSLNPSIIHGIHQIHQISLPCPDLPCHFPPYRRDKPYHSRQTSFFSAP